MKVSKEELLQLFEEFNQKNVLIIGDVMVDAYYWGSVDRISPEAPVPIVAVNKKELRMGGAANVALNIQALGAKPILCSIIGQDEEGDEFVELLKNKQQSDKGIVRFPGRLTTKKTRIIGNHHQMLRIDAETTNPISKEEENQFIDQIKSILISDKIDVIIFEDYDKGSITKKVISEIVNAAKAQGIPTAVDPKKVNFTNYKNVDLFKPNLKELKEGLKIDFEAENSSELRQAIEKLEEKLEHHSTLLTLSELGVYIKSSNAEHHIEAHLRDITDVSGAGDTVISVASLCLACKKDEELIASLSNLAGGLVCENVGVVPINKAMLLKEAIQVFS